MANPKAKKKISTKYIFVVGGVMSSVGKGVASASIANILKSRGYAVTNVKCDMYINIDAGTIRPTEHGEVFVGEDGIEADQDLGNYERFTGNPVTKVNYITTGQVYQEVIRKERNLEYGGEDVEVVPDIPNEIIRRIKLAAKTDKAEVTVIEFGGTVGEYQVLLFLEAARMMKLETPKDVLFAIVSYLPIPEKIGEMKTKPTQYAVRTLNSAGIQPDFIIARAARPLDEKRREKLGIFCNISKDDVVSAPDVDSIYEIPLNFEKEGLGDRILNKFGLKARKKDAKDWQDMVNRMNSAKKSVDIGIVGKYFSTGDFCLSDSYISVIEAVKHAGAANGCKPCLHWINTDEIEKNGISELKKYDGIIVPQGWGSRGSEGKIKTIEYCRKNKVPYFGLCYGMQMAVIEFARNVLGYKDANSEEVNPRTTHPVIHIMPEQKELIAKKQYGGTIRLGGWPCKIISGTRLEKAYRKAGVKVEIISERHRHRYEFNNAFREEMEKAGLKIAGTSPDGLIVEAVEIKDHPFFIGTQFHPEYISRPLNPHPLFVEFVRVCLGNK